MAMSNGFGSFWVGNSGLQSSQLAMNVTANNLSNLTTEGYVRQQVLQSDKNYNVVDTNQAIAKSLVGEGVTVAEVVHTRDLFLDKYYRTENGRQSFYETLNETTDELETIFQELEGAQFQTTLTSLREAFDEFAKYPSDSVNQNLVVQKASLYIARAQSVQDSLKEYQENLNTQVQDTVDTINSLGQTIADLNKQIAKIEAGGQETAYDLRDERDTALDELAQYVNIDYKELSDGTVRVKVEGTEFVEIDEVYEMGTYKDSNGYVIPDWVTLSDEDTGDYYDVYDMYQTIDTDANTNVGSLRALLLSRGNEVSNYVDLLGLDGISNDLVGTCTVMEAQAKLDTLIHTMVTEINNILSPITAVNGGQTFTYNSSTDTVTGSDGNTYTLATDADSRKYFQTEDAFGNTVNVYVDDSATSSDDQFYLLGVDGQKISWNTANVWDQVNGAVGSSGEGPGLELFSRNFTDRYNEVSVSVTDADGNTTIQTYYVYNEEDPTDTTTMYTLNDLQVNPELVDDATKIPYQYLTGDEAMDMASQLSLIWDEDLDSIDGYDFMDYYASLIDDIANLGSVYDSMESTLSTTVDTIDSQRQSVIAVSSDEELTNMIKYQNAYNAASRFINVVNDMTEILVNLI